MKLHCDIHNKCKTIVFRSNFPFVYNLIKDGILRANLWMHVHQILCLFIKHVSIFHVLITASPASTA